MSNCRPAPRLAGGSVRFLVRNPTRLHTSVAKLGLEVSEYTDGNRRSLCYLEFANRLADQAV
jgi:hypothetical protein